jgi:protein-disulfide isomerase
MSQQVSEQERARQVAELRAARLRKERNRRIAAIVGILVVVGAAVAAGTWFNSESGTTADDSSVEVAVGDGSLLVGSGAAPVQVVVYEDFGCAACRDLEDATRDFLRENAAKGKVRVEYRPVPLVTATPYAEQAMNAWAAVLAHSSATDALKLHDLLFEKQPAPSSSPSSSPSGSPGATTAGTAEATVAAMVKEAGADNAAVLAALRTSDDAFLAAVSRAAADKGITTAPTVFVNGRQQTGTSTLAVAEAIEKAVSRGA